MCHRGNTWSNDVTNFRSTARASAGQTNFGLETWAEAVVLPFHLPFAPYACLERLQIHLENIMGPVLFPPSGHNHLLVYVDRFVMRPGATYYPHIGKQLPCFDFVCEQQISLFCLISLLRMQSTSHNSVGMWSSISENRGLCLRCNVLSVFSASLAIQELENISRLYSPIPLLSISWAKTQASTPMTPNLLGLRLYSPISHSRLCAGYLHRLDLPVKDRICLKHIKHLKHRHNGPPHFQMSHHYIGSLTVCEQQLKQLKQ